MTQPQTAPASIVNRYPGACAKCSARVKPEEGRALKVGGAWRTYHLTCLPEAARVAAAPAAPVVRLFAAPEGVEVTVTGGLGSRFGAYKAAQDAAGLRWDRDTKRVTGNATQAAAFILAAKALQGLTLVVEPSAASALQQGAEQAQGEVRAAAQRAAVVDAALALKGGGLYPYQRTGVQWLAPRASALLADDMGLGKTIQALLAAPEGAPLLVVCPAVAKAVWVREAARWRPDLGVALLSGRGSFRWPAPGEMVVINYDILPAELEAQAPTGTVVVADEAHALKSAQAQRTERFRALGASARANGGRTWLLTATPVLNRPQELYALLRAAGCERQGIGGWDGLLAAFDGHKGRWGGWEWHRNTLRDSDLTRLQGVILRRNKIEVLQDLPPKRIEVLEVAVDRATLKACDLAVRAAEARGGLDAVLREIEGGEVSFEGLASARAALAVGKAAALSDLLDQIEEEDAGPVVVFSAHRAAVDVVGAREGWATITGDTPPERRGQIEDAFQAGRLKGVAGTIQAMGVAITLTRATRAIFVDEAFTPALNQQAQDRIYRIGQTRGTLITRLVANHPVDARVMALLDQKQALLDGSVERVTRLGSDVVSSTTDLDAALVSLEQVHLDAARMLGAAAARDATLAALIREVEEADAARGTMSDSDRAAARFRAAVHRGAERRALDMGARRGPATDREVWALQALAILAGADADHAQEENGVGYNKPDSYRGHALTWLAADGGLDDATWEEAVAMAWRYPAQVGRPAPQDGQGAQAAKAADVAVKAAREVARAEERVALAAHTLRERRQGNDETRRMSLLARAAKLRLWAEQSLSGTNDHARYTHEAEQAEAEAANLVGDAALVTALAEAEVKLTKARAKQAKLTA